MNRLALSAWIIFACLELSCSGCPKGWFGSSCQYKCRCANQQCEAFDGNCLDGVKCMPGWFGPACQYADLAYTDTEDQKRTPVSLITDGNENTCLTANEENEVNVSLTAPEFLSWFRVHVRDSYYLNKLKIQFKKQSNSELLACENSSTALVSDTALDIHCDLAVKVTQVILTGESVQSLCSFYISGGRNVALKQNTTQTSLYDSRSHAYKAVDGDRNAHFENGDCTHTKLFDPQPTWNVTLSHPASVNRYVIYNRDEGTYVDERLQRFILISYAPAGAAVFAFIDKAWTEQEVYTVPSPPTEVQTVSIGAVKNHPIDHIILTLCEVEVYGDSVCEPGLYGRDCEHKCNCADRNETCFVSTGGCPSGCPPGYQGENCSQVCQKGWYGPSCQYKCHCHLELCAPADGSCTQGSSCASGWFGPGCQYEDLVKSATLDQNLLPPFVVRDGNDHTCVDDSTQQVVIAWIIPYEFTWLRAVVKDPKFLSTLSLQFKANESADSINCTNRQQARVSETTMDIHCDMQELVKQVILTGEGVNYLCSLYISGGRNVALKQRTEQSSTFEESTKSLSRNAVDGNRDSDLDHGSCTHTDTGDDKPMWSIYLPGNLLVNRYVIYNRDAATHRLQGFLLESYNDKRVKVFTFKDMAPTFLNVYTITSSPASSVSLVTIQVSHWDKVFNANYLTLCEVEIFGDNVCEPGLYGRECEHKCACADSNDTCFVSTGGCPSGCARGLEASCGQVCRNGTHGPDCSNSCSQFCRMGDDNTTACDLVNGACLFGCQPGYFGSTCYEECENGHYGQDCNSICPRLCHVSTSEQRVCHHVDGACLQGCQAGYTGSLCDQKCIGGTYGHDCSWLCPQSCETGNMSQPVCDPIHGTCLLGCQAGYLGSMCDAICEKGIYGPGCTQWCPKHCKVKGMDDAICHHTNGTCLQGCQTGYMGPMCNKSCDPGTYGEDCRSSCSQFCVKWDNGGSVCDQVDGRCLHGCQAGYQGPKCDELCEKGIYGPGCTQWCPKQCKVKGMDDAICHHTNGTCLQGCQTGYMGPMCNKSCDPGTYGEDCRSSCSQFCVNGDNGGSVCDQVDGRCLHGCQAGYQGPKCDERCARGTYGEACSSSCSQFCSSSGCDNMDDECLLGCEDDYQESQCDESCGHETYEVCSSSSEFCGESVCDNINGRCVYRCQPGYKGLQCDKPCGHGRYGEDCRYNCSQFCVKGDLSEPYCHHVSGTCLHGCQAGYEGPRCYERCKPGFYGPGCSLDCHRGCRGLTNAVALCHHIEGTCWLGCLSGFRGPACNESCDHGRYGEDCRSNCSQFCVKGDLSEPYCHHVSGKCLQGCQAGYEGPHCDEPCARGTYGEACSSSCSQFCSSSGCDNMDDECLLGCEDDYQESQCDESCGRVTYGDDCGSQFCSKSVCDHIDGRCLQGCQSGYWGTKCDKHCDGQTHGRDCNSTCPQHCENIKTSLSVCDHVSGVCTQGCQPGYTGDRCDQRCDGQTHGRDCNSTCPQHCENINTSLSVCDHVSGVCTQGCQPGYTGDRCDQHCDGLTHGRDCNSTCPQHCENINTSLSVCDHVSGVCTQGCQPGYTGDRCDQHCDRGRHGQGCNSTCPQHCENINISLSVCDHVSGVCTQGCLPGYTGDRCDQLSEKANTSIENNSTFTAKVVPARKENSLTHSASRTAGAVAGGIIVAVVVVVGVLILWRFKVFGKFKMWTSSRNSRQRSDSTTIMMTTELSEVNR
ncbi:hypothetical protein BsWGS_24417 [Bradybaena similaris]